MGLLGIGKGVFKIAKGVVEGDAEEIILGAKKTVINAATSVGIAIQENFWKKLILMTINRYPLIQCELTHTVIL